MARIRGELAGVMMGEVIVDVHLVVNENLRER